MAGKQGKRHKPDAVSWRKVHSDAGGRARAIKAKLRREDKTFSDSTEIVRADRDGGHD